MAPIDVVPPPRDGFADACAEAAELEGLSFEERFQLLDDACAAVFQILEHHPDRQQILDYRDPLPADAEAVFARARHARPTLG